MLPFADSFADPPMLKFWKKKPADPPAEGIAPEPVALPEPIVPPELIAPPEPERPAEPTSSAPAAGWFQRLGSSSFSKSVRGLFQRNPLLDESLLEELETSLLTADVGVKATGELIAEFGARMRKREFADADALLAALRERLKSWLAPLEQPLQVERARPFVILVVGVNGAGKTTTIGKLARRYRNQGLQLLLAAGDTFRAAAVEQLIAWGDRNQVAVISQGPGADSASVIFDSVQAARNRGCDLLIADTAGRLHTQGGLMAELGKVRRVLTKLDPGYPHEVLMVIDGSTGQNAINQVRQFSEAVAVTGLVVTKLDGTARGGVVFALAREFGLPIRFLGLGEGAEDLRPFSAAAFVDGLLPAREKNHTGSA